jgi:hypothetical protein
MHELMLSGDSEAEQYKAKLRKALGDLDLPVGPSTTQLYPEPMDIDSYDSNHNSDVDTDIPQTRTTVVDPDKPQEFQGAAKPQGRGQSFLEWVDADQFAGQRVNNIYYPFASESEWQMASFLLRSSMTMKDIDDFLALDMVSYVPNITLLFLNMLRSEIVCLSHSTRPKNCVHGLSFCQVDRRGSYKQLLTLNIRPKPPLSFIIVTRWNVSSSSSETRS